MCGLTGFLLGDDRARPPDLRRTVERMSLRLAHRGPDGAGTWHDDAAGVALGHRRLAIVDLSDAGRQPMLSARGRFVTVYNGEIYNFPELRADLDGHGHAFRGRSDTEVLLAAIETWGLDATLRRVVGMFALAVWDRRDRILHLARDRLGKKPLYVALADGALLFASELKALHAFPGFVPAVDRDVLHLFVRHGYVPDPYGIYEGTLKLPPGSSLSVRAADLQGLDAADLCRRTRVYWSAAEVAQQGQAEPLDLPEAGAADELDRLLRLAVAQRMIADVPLGAFLSGGIDSSLVVALMQAQSTRPVRTFTVGFDHRGYDEAGDARRVARHLGADHTELRVTPAEALATIPQMAETYDEPFGDSSQIPTYLVARLARRHVTVALSGDGGDESFGGYVRYFQAARMAALFRLPQVARAAAGTLLTAVRPAAWDAAIASGRRVLPAHVARALSGERIHKFAGVLALRDAVAVYHGLVSTWREPAALVVGGREPPTAVSGYAWAEGYLPNLMSRMMFLDTVSYLPGDILVKVDRATMAVSLEARCPLLDHRVVELAWRLPIDLKVKGGQGKRLLRKVLARYVPTELVDRPKQGFGPPLGEWLRGPLRDWAEALLDPARLRQDGLLRPEPIRHGWAQHRAGTRSWAYQLWNILMLQAWLERWQHAGVGERADAA
jgi:asparagine synthase (glutamine-hydrolysing)